MGRAKGEKCRCILGITKKRAAKREIVRTIDCPVHGVCQLPACGCSGPPHAM